jgi:hypothetical protein
VQIAEIHAAMDRMTGLIAASRSRPALDPLLPRVRGELGQLWGTRVVETSRLPPSDVWVRPGRVPSRAAGRRGTRRAWKRAHPPKYLPIGKPHPVMVAGTLYVSPGDADALRRYAAQHCADREPGRIV